MAEGMLSLSWNNHSSTFTNTLASLREKARYSDVTLSCDGKFYPAHKLVLSTCSDYFLSMFELTPCKHPVVVLQDVRSKEMEALLSYMYVGVVSVAQSDLPQLIKVAEALQIKGLAVPDENVCSNMKYGHTWSPTGGRNSPFPKNIKKEENGTQTHRPSDHKPGFSPQSMPRHSPQGYSPISSSYGNTSNTHRYSPYSREESQATHRCSGKKDHIIVPRVTPKIEYKYNNKQTTYKPYAKPDSGCKGVYRPDNGRMDDGKESVSDENQENRCLDTDDENSSEMQEVLPVSLVKVEVKDDEDDEHIDVDDTGVDSTQDSNQPLPLLVLKREPAEDHRSVSSGSERPNLHYPPWIALREAH